MQSQKNSIQLELGRRLSARKLSPGKFDIDDYIGMESCVDLKDNNNHDDEADMPPANFSDKNICGNSRRDKMWGKKRKDFPPPIPLLVRTENLPSHMPWVLKRQYTADGRLILTEEKVRHHEYFRAHRSDGRLMLQLVAVDDHITTSHFSDENVEVGNGEIESSSDHSQDQDDNNDRDDCIVKDGQDFDNGDQNESPKMVGGGGSEAGKCFKYGTARDADSAFMFGVAVPESLRAVQSKLQICEHFM